MERKRARVRGERRSRRRVENSAPISSVVELPPELRGQTVAPQNPHKSRKISKTTSPSYLENFQSNLCLGLNTFAIQRGDKSELVCSSQSTEEELRTFQPAVNHDEGAGLIRSRFHAIKSLSKEYNALCDYVELSRYRADRMVLVSEHYTKSLADIRDTLKNNVGQLIIVAFELLRMLEILHSHAIIHRNLRLDNILLDTQGNLKLAGYGLYWMTLESRCVPFAFGDPLHLAPEFLLPHLYPSLSFALAAEELTKSSSPCTSRKNRRANRKENEQFTRDHTIPRNMQYSEAFDHAPIPVNLDHDYDDDMVDDHATLDDSSPNQSLSSSPNQNSRSIVRNLSIQGDDSSQDTSDQDAGDESEPSSSSKDEQDGVYNGETTRNQFEQQLVRQAFQVDSDFNLNLKADIWSVGIILLQCLQGMDPAPILKIDKNNNKNNNSTGDDDGATRADEPSIHSNESYPNSLRVLDQLSLIVSGMKRSAPTEIQAFDRKSSSSTSSHSRCGAFSDANIPQLSATSGGSGYCWCIEEERLRGTNNLAPGATPSALPDYHIKQTSQVQLPLCLACWMNCRKLRPAATYQSNAVAHDPTKSRGNDVPRNSQRRADADNSTRSLKDQLLDVIQACLVIDPAGRPTATALLNYPVFKSIFAKLHQHQIQQQQSSSPSSSVPPSSSSTSSSANSPSPVNRVNLRMDFWAPTSGLASSHMDLSQVKLDLPTDLCAELGLDRSLFSRSSSSSSSSSANSASSTGSRLGGQDSKSNRRERRSRRRAGEQRPQRDQPSVQAKGKGQQQSNLDEEEIMRFPNPYFQLVSDRSGKQGNDFIRSNSWNMEELYYLWKYGGGHLEGELARLGLLDVTPAIQQLPLLILANDDDDNDGKNINSSDHHKDVNDIDSNGNTRVTSGDHSISTSAPSVSSTSASSPLSSSSSSSSVSPSDDSAGGGLLDDGLLDNEIDENTDHKVDQDLHLNGQASTSSTTSVHDDLESSDHSSASQDSDALPKSESRPLDYVNGIAVATGIKKQRRLQQQRRNNSYRPGDPWVIGVTKPVSKYHTRILSLNINWILKIISEEYQKMKKDDAVDTSPTLGEDGKERKEQPQSTPQNASADSSMSQDELVFRMCVSRMTRYHRLLEHSPATRQELIKYARSLIQQSPTRASSSSSASASASSPSTSPSSTKAVVVVSASSPSPYSSSFSAIPSVLRRKLWPVFLNVYGCDVEARYNMIDVESVTPLDHQLKVDIARCHQYHQDLNSPIGREKMLRVLKAWLRVNPSLTYWQGLDSVCAPLVTLFFDCEALAFSCLDRLIAKFLRPFLVAGRTGMLNRHLDLFSVLFNFHDPELALHLHNIGFLPELYAIPWFLTLFSHIFPLDHVSLVWDVMLLQDSAFPLFVALSILRCLRKRLLRLDFNDCVMFFANLNLATIDVQQCVRQSLLAMEFTDASLFDPANVPPPRTLPSDGNDRKAGGRGANAKSHQRDNPPARTITSPRLAADSLAKLLLHSSHNPADARGSSSPFSVSDNGSDILLLDIRGQLEYQAWHINSTLNVPISDDGRSAASSGRTIFQSVNRVLDLLKKRTRSQRARTWTVVLGPDEEAEQLFALELMRNKLRRVCILKGGIAGVRPLLPTSFLSGDLIHNSSPSSTSSSSSSVTSKKPSSSKSSSGVSSTPRRTRRTAGRGNQ